MPNNSLRNALFLKRKLAEAQQSITLPSDNQVLNEALTKFNTQFEEIIAQMEAIEIDDVLSTHQADQDTRQLFLNSLNLNRGDHNQRRFFHVALPKRAYLEDQISRLTKTFIERVEDENLSAALLEAYQKHHINEILYHNGVIGYYTTGAIMRFADTETHLYDKEKFPPLGPFAVKFAMVGLGIATLSVSFFTTVALLGLSGGWVIAATALFSAAMAYMGGLLYSILNDIFATKANLPYFLLGHQDTQHSFFSSNDPLVQAIGWGIIAAQPIAVIAALVFGITTAIMMASSAPVLTFILPLMLVVVPLFAVCANAYAEYSANNYIKEGISFKMLPKEIKEKLRTALKLPADAEKLDLDQVDFDSPAFRSLIKELGALNDYQLDGLALMSSSKKDKANWLANGERNLLGYVVTPLLAITSLTLMLTLTSVPAVLFSPLLSVIIPVVSAVIAIALLATALHYVSTNQDKQVDNRYKLFTNLGSGEKKMDELHVTDEQADEAPML